MTAFRWVLAVLTALTLGGALLSFAVFMLRDGQEWLVLARRFRHWAYLTLLFWINSEIWGGVIAALIDW